jgi:hypothetical protein
MVKGCSVAFGACFFFVGIVDEHNITHRVLGLPWCRFLADRPQSTHSLRFRRH